MDTKEILKKVRKIEIKTKRLSNHIFSGEYHSSFKGKGMTFDEVRKYHFGDDIRNIDWNVTARLNEPYVKVFEEERDLTMMLLIDISGSGNFGSSIQVKKDIVTEISATLAFSALQNNDKVGVILFSDDIELFIPPKKGKRHILRIIRELIEFSPKSRRTDISKAIEYLLRAVKKRAIVFAVSDFVGGGYANVLKIISKKHDFTGIRVYDQREYQMPNIGMVQMLDAETGKSVLVNTASRKVRDSYREYYLQNLHYFRDSFTVSGAGSLSTEISESYVKKLLGYFKQK